MNIDEIQGRRPTMAKRCGWKWIPLVVVLAVLSQGCKDAPQSVPKADWPTLAAEIENAAKEVVKAEAALDSFEKERQSASFRPQEKPREKSKYTTVDALSMNLEQPVVEAPRNWTVEQERLAGKIVTAREQFWAKCAIAYKDGFKDRAQKEKSCN